MRCRRCHALKEDHIKYSGRLDLICPTRAPGVFTTEGFQVSSKTRELRVQLDVVEARIRGASDKEDWIAVMRAMSRGVDIVRDIVRKMD